MLKSIVKVDWTPVIKSGYKIDGYYIATNFLFHAVDFIVKLIFTSLLQSSLFLCTKPILYSICFNLQKIFLSCVVLCLYSRLVLGTLPHRYFLFFSLFLYSLRPLFEQSDKVITRHDKLIEGLIEGDSCVGSNWDKFPGYQLSFYPSRNSIYPKNVFIFHSILM